jgi:hypothetical protein
MTLSSGLAARVFADSRLSVQAQQAQLALLAPPVREPAVSRLVLDLRDARDRAERRLTLV